MPNLEERKVAALESIGKSFAKAAQELHVMNQRSAETIRVLRALREDSNGSNSVDVPAPVVDLGNTE